MEIADDAMVQLPVQQLLMASDGMLQGVLSYDQRRGGAVPHLRVGTLPATVSPCRGQPLAQAVALSLNGGGCRLTRGHYRLQAAMLAVGFVLKNLLQSSRSRSCGFESVFMTDSFSHARLSWRALQILILYGIAARATVRDGQGPTINFKIQPSGGWEQAQARGLRRAWAVVPGGALTGRRRPSRA
eukprot:6197738-Pleurochrysis_carterae.AAC.1